LRSRPDRPGAPWRAWALALVLTTPAMSIHAADAAASAPPAVTVEQVKGIVAELQGATGPTGHTERRLRWIPGEAASRPKPGDTPSWLIDWVRWLSRGGRGLVWVLGAIVVALLLVFAWRWARVRADAERERSALRPSHVGDLDIRPESLPDDIGAAALALLARGEHRAALSLLYRGALSRLVHDHGVEIGAASTEGECLNLVRRAMPASVAAFFERLVRIWQAEVYAGRPADAAGIRALCEPFDAHLGAPRASVPAARAAA
jgi:hypothetical protein